jgi:hypothetical protein
MSKNKRGKNKDKSRKNSSGLFLTQIKSPFADVPQEVVNKLLIETGQRYEKEFEESLKRLVEKIRSVDVLHLISVLAAYGLSVGMTESGKTSQKSNSTIRQSHVELVQALALSLPVTEHSSKPATPQEVQEIWDLLLTFDTAFNLKRLAQIQNATTEQQKAILGLQEDLRLHTHMVRNWGYFRHVISITKRLYLALDPVFQEAVGIGATSIIDIFDELVTYTEAVNERFQKTKLVFKARTIEQAVTVYYELAQLSESPKETINDFLEQNVSLEEVRFSILSHSELLLAESFTFSVTDLAGAMNLDSEKLEYALSKLSYQFGDLNNCNPEHFFLGNPVWMKPLI